jgi:DNA-binding CsgD family transcriptional regulator
MLRDTLVRLIYESIDEPKKRKEFLAAFAEVLEASAVALILQDRQLRWAIFCASHGVEQATRDAYENHWVGLNPWALRSPEVTGQTRIDGEILTQAELRETELYAGWLRPNAWEYTSALVIHATPAEYAMLCAYRHTRPFTEQERAVYQALAPHLAIATRIKRRLAELKDTIDRYRHGSPEIETLATLNLSPAETRVALALFKGQTAAEYARLSGLSSSTVKWYAQKIYQKAGVRGQTDLIRLLIERFRS